jgi:hypothetical protein
MTRSKLTTLATIIGVIVAILLFDDLIAAGLGKLGDLSTGQIAWRVVPLIVGGVALVVIVIRLRRTNPGPKRER